MQTPARRLRWVFILCAAACRPTSTAPPATPKAPVRTPDTLESIRAEVSEILDREQTLEQSQCDRWVVRLDALYERDPDAYRVALLDAGRIARSCGDVDDAQAYYERAMLEGPRWMRAEAELGLALAARLEGALADVERYARRAAELDPGLVEARLLLARVLIERHVAGHDEPRLRRRSVGDAEPRLPEAIALAHRLIAANPTLDEARVLWAWARVLASGGVSRHQLVVRNQLTSVLESEDSPWKSEAMFVVGLAALRAGDENAALREFERALERDPTQPDAAGHAAVLLVKMRNYARALELLPRALSDPRFTDDPTLLRAQAAAYTQLEQFGRANRVYERLHGLEPSDPTNDYDLAHLAEIMALREKDDPAREQLLADAARHYRTFLQSEGPSSAASREHALDYLHHYAHPDFATRAFADPAETEGRGDPLMDL